MNNCCKNTDKEIWRQTHEDYYSPSIHVTEQGAIGIKCGGHVIVATVQDWHNWGKEALLDAVDHAVPAEPPKPTGEPAAFKRPCFTCGHQGNIMDKYCGSCGIEHLNWIPKSAECKNRVQVCPECNIDMYQDISTKNAGFWVWYCPECGQEIKIT